MSRIGPYSTPTVLAKLDGRTREARLMQKVRDDLTGHLGGDLTAPQTALVERAAWLSLHVALMDEKMLQEGEGRVQNVVVVSINRSSISIFIPISLYMALIIIIIIIIIK